MVFKYVDKLLAKINKKDLVVENPGSPLYTEMKSNIVKRLLEFIIGRGAYLQIKHPLHANK